MRLIGPVGVLLLYTTVEALPGNRKEPYPGYSQYWSSPEVSGELGFPNDNEDDASLDNWIDEVGDVAIESSLYLHQSRNGLGGDNLYLDDDMGDGLSLLTRSSKISLIR